MLDALQYHEATKHHFHRFARAVGHLDWPTQPDPFRRYAGAPLVELPRAALASDVPYEALYEDARSGPTRSPQTLDIHSLGEFLRCSMGLSAWKQHGRSRWALRVNPSSGNLHPTEAYVVWNGRIWHYAPRAHVLEQRGVLDEGASDDALYVGLTSIHWREAWKYGERAFRYCLHDVGHAIGALRLAAAMLGWRLALLPHWPEARIAALFGLDRDADYPDDAEREEPECLAVVAAGSLPTSPPRLGTPRDWTGTANRLSPARVEWPIIDEVAAATRFSGATPATLVPSSAPAVADAAVPSPAPARSHAAAGQIPPDARRIILQRRSALAFAPGVLRRDTFFSMLRRLQPGAPPWDAIGWPPLVHLAIFVHRVENVTPGLYAYLRDRAVLAEWKSSMQADFLWERVEDACYLLVPIDCRRAANRVSCDQEIAEDGFFSLGMIARVESTLRNGGQWWYRRLFWECGLIGQVLYLEAEAAGARATGIGCFYDDPVHQTLGLQGREWQSLYHFSMGVPVDDARLTTEPGYEWER